MDTNQTGKKAELLFIVSRINLHVECIRYSLDYLKWVYMRTLLIFSILATVDGGQHILSLERQRKVPAQKYSTELLWTGSATKGILVT